MRPFSKIFGKPHHRIVVGSRQGKQKNFRAFAKTPPFHRCSGEQRAEHAAAIAILVEQASISANQSRRGKRQFFRASFYHGAKIRNSAVFAPRGKLVGECLPQTLLCALAGEKTENSFCYFPKSCPMGEVESFFTPNAKKFLLFPEKFSNERGREISPPKVEKSCPIGGVRGKILRPKSEKIQQ